MTQIQAIITKEQNILLQYPSSGKTLQKKTTTTFNRKNMLLSLRPDIHVVSIVLTFC